MHELDDVEADQPGATRNPVDDFDRLELRRSAGLAHGAPMTAMSTGGGAPPEGSATVRASIPGKVVALNAPNIVPRSATLAISPGEEISPGVDPRHPEWG